MKFVRTGHREKGAIFDLSGTPSKAREEEASLDFKCGVVLMTDDDKSVDCIKSVEDIVSTAVISKIQEATVK